MAQLSSEDLLVPCPNCDMPKAVTGWGNPHCYVCGHVDVSLIQERTHLRTTSKRRDTNKGFESDSPYVGEWAWKELIRIYLTPEIWGTDCELSSYLTNSVDNLCTWLGNDGALEK